MNKWTDKEITIRLMGPTEEDEDWEDEEEIEDEEDWDYLDDEELDDYGDYDEEEEEY